MAEDQKSRQSQCSGRQHRQPCKLRPLELNWAGGDLYGRDLLDLDEADSELLNSRPRSRETERNPIVDADWDRKPSPDMPTEWAGMNLIYHKSPNLVPSKSRSNASRESPGCPPTLLELEVQALARVGVLKLYHDGRDLEREKESVEEEEKLARIDQFDRQRQALSPLAGQYTQNLRALDRMAAASIDGSSWPLPPRAPGGADLLELQKAALSSFKNTQSLQGMASAPSALMSALVGAANGDLRERQKAAFSSMQKVPPEKTSAMTTPPAVSGPDPIELQTLALSSGQNLSPGLFAATHWPPDLIAQDLLELQKLAMSNMKSFPPDVVPATVRPPDLPGQDLLELQKEALKKAPHGVASATVRPPDFIGSDLLGLHRAALGSVKKAVQELSSSSPSTSSTREPHIASADLLELQRAALALVTGHQSESARSAMVSTSQTAEPVTVLQNIGLDLLKPENTAVRNTPAPQLTGAEDSKLQKEAWKCIQNQSDSNPVPGSTPTPQAGGPYELLELQKLALKGIQREQAGSSSLVASPSSIPEAFQAVELLESQSASLQDVQIQSALIEPPQQRGGGDLLELQKMALRVISPDVSLTSASAPVLQSTLNQSTFAPDAAPVTQSRGDLMELQKEAPARTCSATGEKTDQTHSELNQTDEAEVPGPSHSISSEYGVESISRRLEQLLQDLLAKDQALQSAHQTIEEKDDLLQTYGGQLAGALNLLESLNLRSMDAKEETAKILVEAEEILGNLNEACCAVERFELPDCCADPQCAQGIHSKQLSQAAPLDEHFRVGAEAGPGINHMEIDERRRLIQEFLNELRNIEGARREAQQSFAIEIERNEQLIVELQEFDAVGPVSQGLVSDYEQTNVTPENNPKEFEGSIEYSQDLSESPSDSNKGKPCDDVNETCDHLYEIVDENANEAPCEGAVGGPFDHPYEVPCDHELEPCYDGADEAPRDRAFAPPTHSTCEAPLDRSRKAPLDYGHGHNQVPRIARASSPDDLWKHLEQFARKDLHPREEVHSHPATPNFAEGGVAVEQKIKELVNELQHKGKEINELQNQIDQLKYFVIQEQGSSIGTKGVLQSAADHGPLAQSDLALKMKETEIKELQNQIDQLTFSLIQEQQKSSGTKDLLQQAIDRASRAQSDLDQKIKEIQGLKDKIHELKEDLSQEQEKGRKALIQHVVDCQSAPIKFDLEKKGTEIHELRDQLHLLETSMHREGEENRKALAHINLNSRLMSDYGLPELRPVSDLQQQVDQMRRELRQEKEASRRALAHVSQCDTRKLEARILARDAKIKELQELIARKEELWLTEKRHIIKDVEERETRLLVKEEEAINLAYELKRSLSSTQSPLSHGFTDVPRQKGVDSGSHFFQKQGNEGSREMLDLRCEVLSLQDCLDMKCRALKSAENELQRSYNSINELRSKLKTSQNAEPNSQRQGQTRNLIEKLRASEERVRKYETETTTMNNKISELSARCKQLEDLEQFYHEGAADVKANAIELDGELERNFEIMKKMQARCREYESQAQGKELEPGFDSAGIDSHGGAADHKEHLRIKHAIQPHEHAELASQCRGLQSQLLQSQEKMVKEDTLLIRSDEDMQRQKARQTPGPGKRKQRTGFGSDDPESKALETKPAPGNANMEISRDQMQEVSTLRDLLREQWKVQKAMEERLNIMMDYVSDRVDEFERESSSDVTSESSLAPTRELNHFHVEAKLMKLQLEEQLQLLRGTLFKSVHHLEGGHQHFGGQNSKGKQHSNISSQSMQLLVEKIALENSAQSLQEKTSRLLNKLTTMRSEISQGVADSDMSD